MAKLYSAADLYFAADLRFAIDCFPYFFLWTFLILRSSWWVFGSNLSLSAETILPENCILQQICILLQIAFLCISFFGPFLLFGLLGGPLGLAFHWAFLRMGFCVLQLTRLSSS